MQAKKLAWLVIGALSLAPIAANTQAAIYHFTGLVTFSSGNYAVPAAMPVAGTYTIRITNATADTETVGSPSGFTSHRKGGSFYGSLPSNTYVFSDTLDAATFSYSNPAAGTYQSLSNVLGSNSGDSDTGFEQQNPTNAAGRESGFIISNHTFSSAHGVAVLNTAELTLSDSCRRGS